MKAFLGIPILFECPFSKAVTSTILGKDLAARNANSDAKDKDGMTPMALTAKLAEVVNDLAARNGSLLNGCLNLC